MDINNIQSQINDVANSQKNVTTTDEMIKWIISVTNVGKQIKTFNDYASELEESINDDCNIGELYYEAQWLKRMIQSYCIGYKDSSNTDQGC